MISALDEATRVFGREQRLQQMQEECAELIVAISHCMRGRCDEERVIDELADVALVVSNLARIYGPERFANALDRSHARLRSAIRVAERKGQP